jgi:ATP-binding cassette subfamily F protein 3
LQKFTGTVVFVSHDRYFIDKLATRVIEIGNGQVEVFPGNYEDYLWRKEGKAEATPDAVLRTGSAATGAVRANEPGVEANQPVLEPREAAGKQKRLNPIKLKQIKDRCQELEEEIARLEAAIATAETALQEFVSVEETQRQSGALERYRAELTSRMQEWEELAQVLEN